MPPMSQIYGRRRESGGPRDGLFQKRFYTVTHHRTSADRGDQMNRPRYINRMLARIFTALPSLAARWGKGLTSEGGEIPWTEPGKPLRDGTLALVTTGGVHLTSQEPFDMSDPHGDPTFREIPVAARREDLVITHDYYDHRDAERDLELVFPVRGLQEMVDRGLLGGLHPVAYGLMGHIEGQWLETLRRETAPRIARELAGAGVDYVLLVPA
jgi:D-proline reductase (dithiol) PrdB